jgi:hypothetical protein
VWWFEKILSVFGLPIKILNLLGGLVGGIWLAIVGEWAAIGIGIAALFVAAFALGFALMPALVFAVPAVKMEESGNKLGSYFFVVLGSCYTIAVFSFWCIGVLFYFLDQATMNTVIPLLLWAYSVATSPISYMAQKEMVEVGNEQSVIFAIFSQIAMIAVIIGLFVAPIDFVNSISVFIAIMFAGLLVQIKIVSEQY